MNLPLARLTWSHPCVLKKKKIIIRFFFLTLRVNYLLEWNLHSIFSKFYQTIFFHYLFNLIFFVPSIFYFFFLLKHRLFFSVLFLSLNFELSIVKDQFVLLLKYFFFFQNQSTYSSKLTLLHRKKAKYGLININFFFFFKICVHTL